MVITRIFIPILQREEIETQRLFLKTHLSTVTMPGLKAVTSNSKSLVFIMKRLKFKFFWEEFDINEGG